MDETSIADLSFDRSPSVFGHEDGYDLWFDLPPKRGDATTSELQTLCQGAILIGSVAETMGWDWSTLIQNVDHLSAPVDGCFLLEVKSPLIRSERFRRALERAIVVSGLDPFKIKVSDGESANIYIFGRGLPQL